MPLALRRAIAGVVALVIAGVLASALRVATAAVPADRLTVSIPTSRLVGGPPVPLPWPTTGQGMLIAPGIGILGSVGGSRPVPIASVAKIMTALVVLADHPLAPGAAGPSLTVTAADAADYLRRVPTGESLLAVRAGEQLTERQALQGLLLPSANNMADLLARWDGGRAGFLARMNAMARRAGMTATRYTDPSGLDPATVSTASDQVRIAELALREPTLMEIVGQPEAVLPVAGRVRNYNALIRDDTGVFGIKTGSTDAAGGCVVFVAHRTIGGTPVTLIGALLGVQVGAPPLAALGDALRASAAVLAKAGTAVTGAPVIPAGQPVGTISTAWGARTSLVVARPSQQRTVRGTRLPLTPRLSCPAAPFARGAPCGRIVVGAGEGLSGRTSYDLAVVAASALPGPSWRWRLQHALPWW